jgi:hypothetical protein
MPFNFSTRFVVLHRSTNGTTVILPPAANLGRPNDVFPARVGALDENIGLQRLSQLERSLFVKQNDGIDQSHLPSPTHPAGWTRSISRAGVASSKITTSST